MLESVKTILLVDDSSTARMIVKQCLEICGFEDKLYLEAANGAEALTVMDRNVVDLMFTDLYMPKMDGMGLLSEVQKRKDRPEYIGVITSAANAAVIQELQSLGADVVVNKPLSPAGLMKAIRKLRREEVEGY